MNAFDALPHDRWADIAAVISRPWPKAAAAHDLRWHAAEHAVYGRILPPVRILAERWGWTRTRTHELIADAPKWIDEARPWQWRVSGVSADKRRTRSGQEADMGDGQTPSNDESADKRRTRSGQEADSRAFHQHPITHHPVSENIYVAEAAPPRLDAGCVCDAMPASIPGAEIRPAEQDHPPHAAPPPSAGKAVPLFGSAPLPDQPCNFHVLAVWLAWRGFHPKHTQDTPPDAQLKAIKTALKHTSVDVLVGIVMWAHTSSHSRAVYLRGDGYKPGGTGAYLSIKSLFVAANLLERQGWWEDWVAAGSPDYRRTGTRSAVTGKRPSAYETLMAMATDTRTPDSELEVLHA